MPVPHEFMHQRGGYLVRDIGHTNVEVWPWRLEHVGMYYLQLMRPFATYICINKEQYRSETKDTSRPCSSSNWADTWQKYELYDKNTNNYNPTHVFAIRFSSSLHILGSNSMAIWRVQSSCCEELFSQSASPSPAFVAASSFTKPTTDHHITPLKRALLTARVHSTSIQDVTSLDTVDLKCNYHFLGQWEQFDGQVTGSGPDLHNHVLVRDFCLGLAQYRVIASAQKWFMV